MSDVPDVPAKRPAKPGHRFAEQPVPRYEGEAERLRPGLLPDQREIPNPGFPGAIVTAGAPASGRMERRHIDGRLMKEVACVGAHLTDCAETPDGWVCPRECQVHDLPMSSTAVTHVDDLIGIVPDVRRRWFRVHWTLSRQSCTRRFRNGRCQIPRDEVIQTVIWHAGDCWTKRGARRRMGELSSPSSS